MGSKDEPDIFASPTDPQPWEEAEIEADKLRDDMRQERGERYMVRERKWSVKEVFINCIAGVVMLVGVAVIAAVGYGVVALIVTAFNTIREAL
jgi:hypothetical protein